jgi:tetratricopeptide (TPR) repeat protein
LAQTAGEHIRYGFDLGQRGAVHSARAEFLRALQLVAWGIDRDQQTNTHVQALENALCALRESDDFSDGQPILAGDADVAAIASGHQTAVLHSPNSARTSPLEALQVYYQYAKQQLALAGDRDPVASQAVHGLARVEAAICNVNPAVRGACGPKAIALYQAAVLIDPTNYRATRELGVMLARFGQLRLAQQAFSRSLSIHPDSTTWDNLAVVCERLGEHQLAQQARRQSQTLATGTHQQDGQSVSRNRDPDVIVKWVDLNTFVDKSGPDPTCVAAQSRAETDAVRPQSEGSSEWTSWTNIFKGLLPAKASRRPAKTSKQATNPSAGKY